MSRKGCVKEARIEHVFRYAHVFPRCIAMLGLRHDRRVAADHRAPTAFDESIAAFEFAARQPTGSVKVQIEMPG